MTATDELRRLLDERGVEHYDGTEMTLWLKDKHGYRASANELHSGRLSVHIWCDTPEQAIEATLGRGECEFEHLIIDDVVDAWECGECGMFCTVVRDDEYGTYKPNYCPSCGRKVRA